MWLTALAAWCSLNPYFLWGALPWSMLAAAAFGSVALVWLVVCGTARPVSKAEAIGISLLTLFILYITFQSRVDGGHSKWVLVLPVAWSVCLMRDEQRSRCYRAFATLFAVSLIPGVLASIAAASGIPMAFTTIPAGNPRFEADGVRLLHLPGALFTESNRMVLPNRGVLFRMNGIYDEPGTVGTIAALLLAATGFRLSDWRSWSLYVAGVLSFSLAFAALATAGLTVSAALRRRWWVLLLLIPVFGATALSLGYVRSSTVAPGQSSSLSVVSPSGSTAPVVAGRQELRQQKYIDNRTLPAMRALIDAYWESSASVVLFGFASDASVVRGGASQTWMRILTDHGLLGFAMLSTGLALSLWPFLRSSHKKPWGLLFLVLFGMSVYQRPVIWVPYATLVLFCGAAVAFRLTPAEGVDVRSNHRS